MRRAVVERVEVVVDGLHLGPLHHGEAETEEDVFELAHRARQHVQPADRLRRRAGQRHVDAVGPRGRARAPRRPTAPRAPRSAPPAPAAPRWRPCRPRPLSAGSQLGDAAQQLRQLGLAAEVAHAQLLERLAGGGLRRSRPRPLLSAPRSARSSLALTLFRREPICLPVISYSATVAAIAAFSESAAIGMLRRALARRQDLLGQPLALGADEQRDIAAPTASAPAGRASDLGASWRRARPARPGSSATAPPARAPPRRSRPCSPARPSARGDRRSPGRAPRRSRRRPARSAAPCRRCPGRRPRAGTRTAVPRALRPALLVDGDHARARAERRDGRQRLRVDVEEALPAEPRAREAVSLERAPSRLLRPRRPDPRPRPRSGRCARARACARRRRSASGRGCVGR